MTARSQLRVEVVGAGVGGLAVARGLHARGHHVTALEEAAGLRAGGAAVSIWCNGTAALRQIDVSEIGHRIDRMESRLADGRSRLDVDVERLSRRLGARRPCRRQPVRRCRDRCGWHAVGRTLRCCRRPSRDAHRLGNVARTHPRPVDLANEHRALVHVAPDGCAVLISAGDGILQWSCDVPWRAGDARQLRKRAFLVSALAGNEHRLLHMARPSIRWFRAVALATWGYGTFLRTASNCL